jgi:hypothetical protein
MSPRKKCASYQQRPPGDWLKKLAKRSSVFATALAHTHLLQIADDHDDLWHEAATAFEKSAVHRRFRVQIARACVSFGGFELTVHGLVFCGVGELMTGASLMVVGIALMYVLGKGG